MTKKQHYVPRFYLERFVDEQGGVHVYDFKQNKFYKTTPEGICCQNCLYEVEWVGALHEALDLMGMGGWDSIVKMAVKKAYLTEEYGGGPVYDLISGIGNLNFTFYQAQEGCFITSDQPVFIGVDKHILTGDKQCLYFALSPKVIVLFGDYEESKHKKNRMVIIKDSFVDDFNMITVNKIKELKGKIIANSREGIMKYKELR